MKAVLILNIPNDIDISKMRIGGDGNIYYMREGERASIVGNIKNIKPLPSKLVPFGYLNAGNKDGLYEKGYNDCIDEITGETE